MRELILRILTKNIFLVLLSLLLSTLMIGYALSSIILGVFIGCSIIRYIFNPVKINLNFNLFLTTLLYLLFLCSIFWTVDINLTIKGLGRTLALLLIPISFSLLEKFTKKDINFVFGFFTKTNVLFCVFFLIIAGYKLIINNNIEAFVYHELVAILDLHAIYVSAYFLISLCYLLHKKMKSKLDFFSILLLFITIVLLSSKVIIGCLILVTLVYFIFFSNLKEGYKEKRLIIIAFLLIFVLTSPFLIKRLNFEGKSNFQEAFTISKVNHTYLWTGTTIRLLQLRFLYDQIAEDNILFKGYGLFASKENLKQRHLEFGTYPGYSNYNYHNMYAQILSELGLLGLIILLTILGINLYFSIKYKSYLYLCFSIITIIWFFTESVLWVQRGLFFFIVLHSIFNKSILDNFKSNVV